MIPTASNYPNAFDTNTNLYEVHDELRVILAEDYKPGNKRIVIYDENNKMGLFPLSGIITLTEQTSDIDQRAISFHYDNTADSALSTWLNSSFEKLEILPGFVDCVKPKDITNVTINVVADHHNNIKESLIAVERFIGIKGTVDTKPFGTTLEGRVAFLTKMVLTPRAWFIADKRLGLVPFTVTFTDQCFRLGTGEITRTWSFTNGISSDTSVMISSSTTAPITLIKTFDEPGKYDVKLTVENEHGSDVLLFEDFINARITSPEEALLEVVIRSTQIGPDTSHDYWVRSPLGTPIEVKVKDGGPPDYNIIRPRSSDTSPYYSYSGELLTSIDTSSSIVTGVPIDPIETYTWALGDDLSHPSSPATKALYSIGGLYDIILRCDTYLSAYRITSHQDKIDIIEDKNLWLWNFPPTTSWPSKSSDAWDLALLGPGTTATVKSYEFGLLSETFKIAGVSQTINRDDSFLTYSNVDVNKRAKKEFRRNIGFTVRGTTYSGMNGDAMLYWASGGLPYSSQTVQMTKYNGFHDTYAVPDNAPVAPEHPWNWICLSDPSKSYFVFGSPNNTAPPDTNPSYRIKHCYDLYAYSPANWTSTTLTQANFLNGADELMQHPSTYSAGVPVDGYFATYRAAWKSERGYFLRNSGTGWAFRISSFYRTDGIFSDPVLNFVKLSDMPVVRTEGQLVPLAQGLFFFNNSGNIAAYNDTTSVWEIGGPSQSSISFSSLQDTNATNFSLQENTLMATSDSLYTAYLSYDYSPNAFIKFNSQDATFTSTGARPSGYQFAMGVY